MLHNPIDVETKSYSAENKMTEFHYHNCYEIYYLYSGKIRYLIDYNLYDVDEGDIVLINKQVLHMTKLVDDRPGENIKVFINDDIINSLGENSKEFFYCLKNNLVLKIPLKDKKFITSLFLKIHSEFKKNNLFSYQLTQNHIYELLTYIYLLMYSSSNIATTVDENETVNKAIRYIQNNFNQNITLYDVASECHMNPSYFSRFFKKQLGINLMSFINTARIKEASLLLTNSDRTVTEIAYDCGYNDVKYFITTFKKVNGCSPSTFRKKNTNFNTN